MASAPTAATDLLRAARDLLVASATDYETAVREFRWPRPATFNFGLEWFDVLAGEHPDRAALTIVEEDGSTQSVSYGELSARSDQVAVWLRSIGVHRGDRIIQTTVTSGDGTFELLPDTMKVAKPLARR